MGSINEQGCDRELQELLAIFYPHLLFIEMVSIQVCEIGNSGVSATIKPLGQPSDENRLS